MKYMGSKRRYAKHLLPFILKDRNPDQWYVEPFVGGANLIDKVKGNRLGGDVNKYTIQALITIRDHVNEVPKDNSDFTEHDYGELKESDNYEFKGYAGFAFSYGAKWMGGWRRDAEGRDYVAEAYRSAVKQSPTLQGVRLWCASYNTLSIPPNSIIYCDPPYYLSTTRYKHELDYPKFWQWCRNMTREGHRVFISENYAPDDFKVLWELEAYTSHVRDVSAKMGIERLYQYRGD